MIVSSGQTMRRQSRHPRVYKGLPASSTHILAAQTSTLIVAETGIKTIAAVHSQCPLLSEPSSEFGSDMQRREFITLPRQHGGRVAACIAGVDELCGERSGRPSPA
jgi:hypothetical protein